MNVTLPTHLNSLRSMLVNKHERDFGFDETNSLQPSVKFLESFLEFSHWLGDMIQGLLKDQTAKNSSELIGSTEIFKTQVAKALIESRTLPLYSDKIMRSHVANRIANIAGFNGPDEFFITLPEVISDNEVQALHDKLEDLIEILFIDSLIQLHRKLKDSQISEDIDVKIQIRSILPHLQKYSIDQVNEAVTYDDELRQVRF